MPQEQTLKPLETTEHKPDHQTEKTSLAMFCSFKLSITKPISASATPQNPESSPPPEHINIPQKPSPRNAIPRRRPPQPSVMQIERAVGAGSFRDDEPDRRMNKDSDMKKTIMDLFLGEVFEGKLQKKLRETGEWLGDNGETRFRNSRKRIVVFVFQWMIPIWAISLLIASGTIKLPFSTPLLDDLLL